MTKSSVKKTVEVKPIASEQRLQPDQFQSMIAEVQMHITTVGDAYTTYIKENQAAPKNVELEPKRKFNRKTAYVDVDGYYCCHTCGKPLCKVKTGD